MRENVSGSHTSTCKGPEVGKSLVCSVNARSVEDDTGGRWGPGSHCAPSFQMGVGRPEVNTQGWLLWLTMRHLGAGLWLWERLRMGWG